MKTFEITFTNDPESKIYSANLVLAENEEQAIAYFSRISSGEIIGCTETLSRPKPGQPVHKVPEGWTDPETELERKLKEYIREKEEKIRNAKSNEDKKFHFYGAFNVIFFLYINNIISQELYNKYNEIIDTANKTYYEKAEKDFEDAYKRVFN